MGLFKVNGHEPIKNPASSLSRYDVWKNFDDMMNSMWPFDARLESGNNDLKAIAPRLNIQESKEGYHIEAELPGVARDQIDISVKDDMLIIKGEKKILMRRKKINIIVLKDLMDHFIAPLECQKISIKKEYLLN